MVATQFNRFDDVLNECKWYLFPIDVKRIFLIFICETQQLTLFRGYGNIECTRQAFERVIDPYVIYEKIQSLTPLFNLIKFLFI